MPPRSSTKRKSSAVSAAETPAKAPRSSTRGSPRHSTPPETPATPATSSSAAASSRRQSSAPASANRRKSAALSLTPDSLSTLHRFTDRLGEVLTFGSGDMSQLGLGDDDSMRERKKPTLLTTLTQAGCSVATVAAGSLHNAVITNHGAVWTWGCNDDGAAGRSDDEWLPSPVDGPLGKEHKGEGADEDHRIVQLHCGASHTVALSGSGLVYAWGTYRDANGVMGFTATVDTAQQPLLIPLRHKAVMIAAGENMDLALTEKGEVYQWGDVGHGVRSGDRHKRSKLTPTLVNIRRRGGVRGGAVKVKQVYAGGASCFAVTDNGEVYSWGPNNYSQTGHRDQSEQDEDDNADGAGEETKEGEEESKSGEASGSKRKAKRRRLSSHQSSNMITVPTLISSLPHPILSIAAAIHHTLFVTTNHTVYSVGKNKDGRLGLGHTDEVNEPALVPGLTDVRSVGAGEVHSLFVCGEGEAGGSVWTCGDGQLLQLGNGEEEDVSTPTRVDSANLDKANRRVVQAVGGSQHSMLLAFKRPEGLIAAAENKAEKKEEEAGEDKMKDVNVE